MSDTSKSAPAKDPKSGNGDKAKGTTNAASGPATDNGAPPRKPKKKGIGVAIFLWAVLILAILGGAGFATWPFWFPILTANLPDSLKEPFKDPRLDGVAERLKALEELAKKRQSTGDAIQDLETERARFSKELAVLIERVGGLEKASDSIKKMVAEATTGGTGGETDEALRSISERLSRLEEDGAEADAAGKSIDSLESRSTQLSAAVADIVARVRALEEMESAAAEARKAGQAVVLAVGQLRGALHSTGPFTNELSGLDAVTAGNAAIAESIAVLEPHAKSGIPNLASLERRFEDLAGRVVQAAAGDDGGWWDLTVKRLSSLVSIRRTDGKGEDDGVEAAIARVEADLRSGDLINAVETLGGLSGPEAGVVASWLADARSRLAAERALADLHVHAISLLKTSAE